MVPPLYAVCSADASVQSLLGTDPMRLFPFGQARQKETYPYAVWQIVGGQPENYLGQVPDVDSISTQIDVYAKTWSSARLVALALRTAVEPVAHVTAYHGEMRDPETESYRISFTVDWITAR